jgi:hypothetical protein
MAKIIYEVVHYNQFTKSYVVIATCETQQEAKEKCGKDWNNFVATKTIEVK